jgi:ribonuclease I
LNTIEELFSKLTIPNLKSALLDKRVDQYKIKKVFLEKNPRLRANQIVIYMKGKELIDIKICYDLKLNFTNCYRK